ncbi:MAG: alpha/beta hydrolase [Mycobacterium sp.]
MTDHFPGFESITADVNDVKLFARVGGPPGGAPLVLLHGFPQSHLCWHQVAPALAERFRVVCLDLKGYGRSETPPGNADHHAYSKRVLAAEVVAFMAELGHQRFSVIGHDRGALIGYRMALDSPEVVKSLVVLDNYPASLIWDRMADDPQFTPHWRTFAQEGPAAEASMTEQSLDRLMAEHTMAGTLDDFDEVVLSSYRRDWSDPAHIHAYCEDYRAGATIDPELDRADLAKGAVVRCPSLVIWGEAFLGRAPEKPTEIWQRTFLPSVRGIEVPGGHFNAEESPKETAAALVGFLQEHLENAV